MVFPRKTLLPWYFVTACFSCFFFFSFESFFRQVLFNMKSLLIVNSLFHKNYAIFLMRFFKNVTLCAFIPCSFQVYTGREQGQDLGLAHRVVKDLAAPYHHTNIRVYMDFYTGVPLLRDLASLGIAACGTVRPNRKLLPSELLPKRIRREKHEFRPAQGFGKTLKQSMSRPISMTQWILALSTGGQPDVWGLARH